MVYQKLIKLTLLLFFLSCSLSTKPDITLAIGSSEEGSTGNLTNIEENTDPKMIQQHLFI